MNKQQLNPHQPPTLTLSQPFVFALTDNCCPSHLAICAAAQLTVHADKR